MTFELFVAANPRAEHWNVAIAETECTQLLSWTQHPIDAGVPSEVGAVICAALGRVGLVSFLASTKEAAGFDGARQVGAAGFVKGLRSHLPRNVILASSRSRDCAPQLFENPSHPWSMQGQVVTLSDPELRTPRLSLEELTLLTDPQSPMDRDRLESNHLMAVSAWGRRLCGDPVLRQSKHLRGDRRSHRRRSTCCRTRCAPGG